MQQDLSTLLGKTTDRTPLASWIDLFLMGVPVDMTWARTAVGARPLEKRIGAGLITIAKDRIFLLPQDLGNR